MLETHKTLLIHITIKFEFKVKILQTFTEINI